ncbi:MAG: NDP-sugar synthase [Candidatus Caldarchaeales archaeon]
MKGVVFAAGLGKRLKPLTLSRPKHLLPIAGKPILKRVLESLLSNNIREIGVVVSYMKELIMSNVSSYNLDIKIDWIIQEEPRGTGQALQVCEEYLKDEDYFIVTYGDITLNHKVVKEMLTFFSKNKCDGVVEGVLVDDTSRFGRIISRNGLLEMIEEKSSSGSGMVNSGLYILPREALDVAKEIKPSSRGEYELTDILNILASRGYKILIHSYYNPYQDIPTRSWWIDIGSPRDYLKANIVVFTEEFGNEIVCGSEVDSSIHIRPPSLINENVKIGGDSIIGPHVFIMEDVEISPNSMIENSILLEGCKVGSKTIIRNTILGEYTEVGEEVYIEGGEDVLVVTPHTVISDKTVLKR